MTRLRVRLLYLDVRRVLSVALLVCRPLRRTVRRRMGVRG